VFFAVVDSRVVHQMKSGSNVKRDEFLGVGRELVGVVVVVDTVPWLTPGTEVIGFTNGGACAEYCALDACDCIKLPRSVDALPAVVYLGPWIEAYTALQEVNCGNSILIVTDQVFEDVLVTAHYATVVMRCIVFVKCMDDKRAKRKMEDIAHGGRVFVLEGSEWANDCLLKTAQMGIDHVLDLRESANCQCVITNNILNVLAYHGSWICAQTSLQLDPPDARRLHAKAATLHFYNPNIWYTVGARKGQLLHAILLLYEHEGWQHMPSLDTVLTWTYKDVCESLHQSRVESIGSDVN